jgi:hypothetical protein
MSPERFGRFENPEKNPDKIKRKLKAVVGEILRVPDFFLNLNIPINLKKTDITEEYKNRDVFDLGSGSGSRYSEIRSLFDPASYVGIDKDPRFVKVGKMKQLKMMQADFISDELEGDMGVAFGTVMSPEIVEKLKQGFNRLVFSEHASTEEEVQEIIKGYEEKLGVTGLDKVVVSKRPARSPGAGYDIYFFLRMDEVTEEAL